MVSLPNVQYALMFWTPDPPGRWPRDPPGLFDATHLRWFTLRDARELLEQAGLEVDVVEPRYWFHGWQLQARAGARTDAARRRSWPGSTCCGDASAGDAGASWSSPRTASRPGLAGTSIRALELGRVPAPTTST